MNGSTLTTFNRLRSAGRAWFNTELVCAPVHALTALIPAPIRTPLSRMPAAICFRKLRRLSVITNLICLDNDTSVSPARQCTVLRSAWRGHFPLTTTQVVVPWLVAQETFPSGIASRWCLPRRQSWRRLSMSLQLLREQAPRRVGTRRAARNGG